MSGWTSSFLPKFKMAELMADGEYCCGTNVFKISVCTKGVK